MTPHGKKTLHERVDLVARELQRYCKLQAVLGTPFVRRPAAAPVVEGGPEPAAQSADALEELRREALACRRCALAQTRNKVVFGAGSPAARLMFVGEAPGYHEDQQGIPFVGKAGQLLTKIIKAIGLTREQVYIANILKCRPPENRNPTPEESISCYPFLIRQIEIIRPEVIVALGGVAAKKLLKTDSPTHQLRGRFHDFRDTRLMVTFHPAYLLRSPARKRETWEDMKKVRDYLAEVTTGGNG